MKIAIVSDTHLAPRARAFLDNWRAVRTWIGRMAPDLTVHLGDITADGENDASEFHAVRGEFSGIPIRFLPGNHDIGDNPGGASAFRPERLVQFRAAFGPDRWCFHGDGWQVIGLNALLFGTGLGEEEEQFAWLETQLASRRGRLGVMLHKPLFRVGPADTELHERYLPPQPRDRLYRLLRRRDLRFVLCGHTHQARRFTEGDVEHVWAPSTAFIIPDGRQETIGEKRVGAMILELDEGGHRFEIFAPEGIVRHNLLDHAEVYPALKAKP